MTKKKVAIFIDSVNIDYAFELLKKSLDLPNSSKLDYMKLIEQLTSDSEIVLKSMYIVIASALNDPALRRFLTYFKLHGFNVVAKEIKTISDAKGIVKKKANHDVEISIDACRFIWHNECDEIVLFSGDSDFAYLVDEAHKFGIVVSIVSSSRTISSELLEKADKVFLLDHGLHIRDMLYEKKAAV